jgi:hypothetical protein
LRFGDIQNIKPKARSNTFFAIIIGSPTNNITLPLILSREIIRILSIYSNARCAQQPAPSLKDFRQKFVGASGLSLSSYLAQYIIASSDSNEELSSSTVAALITVIELAVMFERKLQISLYRRFVSHRGNISKLGP